MGVVQLIPALIPDIPSMSPAPPAEPAAPTFSLYDVAIGGIGFLFSNTPNNPMERALVPLEKQRIDQAQDPGEQTLTSWWIKSQESWHGGAGQAQMEPAFPTPFDHVRFDICKNVDVFVPGRVSRLPDTTVISADDANQVVSVTLSGADAVAYLTPGGVVKLITDPAGTPTVTTFTAVTGAKSIASDGTRIYAATATTVYKLDPATPAGSTTLATFSSATDVALGWVKARLMLGCAGAIYELDVSLTGVALTSASTEFRYQHPTTGWVWRCFGTSPTAVLAAGDGGGYSAVTQFQLANVSGAPVLEVVGDIAQLPVGERVLSLANPQGTFIIIGTTAGVRVGTTDTYTGALTYGPLELLPTDPVIPANGLATRDRFVYVAGMAYDEGGLICVDLGTQVDQSGRFAWSPHLITPTATVTAATSVGVLPVSGSLIFSVPGTGVLLEGVGPGVGRESWLRTSKIRFDTVEPKLFKLCRVRGDLTSGEIKVTAVTPFSTAIPITVGFTETDPAEFRLPPDLLEWLQLTLELLGESTQLTSWQTKALPGARRQLRFKFVLSISDHETTRTGHKVYDALSSRERLAAIEEMAQRGDEVLLQEFTPTGVISSRVVIEDMDFQEVGRPAPRSDIGGDLVIVLRTVES